MRRVECSEEYQVESGIVCLMTDALTQETQHEIALRKQEYETMPDTFVPPTSGWRTEFADRIEIPPHLNALQLMEGHRVLEIGCGDGRFTIPMVQLGADVLAVDFSIEALLTMSRNVSSGVAPTTYKVVPRRPADAVRRHVGLVQVDAMIPCSDVREHSGRSS